MSYTNQDHQDLELAHDLLHWASELVNGVMERNRTDLTMQMVSFLCEAKRDADLGEREITMAEKYMQWSGASTASTVDSSAAADMQWQSHGQASA